MVWSLGFGVRGFGLGVENRVSRFWVRVLGSRFRISSFGLTGSGFGIRDSGFRIQDWGLGLRDELCADGKLGAASHVLLCASNIPAVIQPTHIVI